MPELPEVETVKRGLQSLIVGHEIIGVDFDWPKSFPNPDSEVKQFLIGSKVFAVRRRAKVLIIDLDTNYSLVIHLKMTGQLVYVKSQSSLEDRWGAGHPNESLVGRLPDRSTRVTLSLKNKANLFFNDQRKFGWMRLMPTVSIEELDFFKKVGPEPLEDEFTSDIFYNAINRRKNSNIKSVLLDQTVLAGVGNIYADESLWGAKIHPSTLTKNISKKQAQNLLRELKYVLLLSIEKGGSTDRNYVNAEGKKGSYIEFARVFRREKMPCPRCQSIIEKTRVAGRGTHFCPSCQVII